MLAELKFSLKFYKGNYLKLITNVLLNLIRMLFSLHTPLVYSQIINDVIAMKKSNMEFLLVELFALYIFGVGINYIAKKIEVKMNRSVICAVKERISDSLLSIPTYKLEEYSMGKIQVLLSADAQVPSSLISTLASTVITVCSVVGIAGTVCAINWQLSLILISTYPITLLVNHIYSKKIKASARTMSQATDKIAGETRKFAEVLEDTKVQGGKNIIYQHFKKVIHEFRTLQERHIGLTLNNSLFISLISLINYISLTTIGFVFVLSGKLLLGTLVAFNTYSKTLSSSLDTLVQLKANLQPSLVSIQRLMEVENIYAEWKQEEEKKEKIGNKIEGIAIKNICKSFDSNEVLNDFTKEFGKGITGIQGPNGCGKTTLMKLLLHSCLPEKGSILFGDRNLNDISLGWIQEQISYVGANKITYNVSLRENLVLFEGGENISDGQIYDALKVVDLWDDVNELPEKLNTMIDDNSGFSSGQIQKMQVARSLLKNAEIMLFDEAFSNIDFDARKKILQYIRNNYKEKIILLISHNKEDYEWCDETVYL